jgi:hypothetical protein
MPSSRELCRAALVRTAVSEERSAFIIKVTIIYEIGTILAVTSNRSTLRPNIPDDGILCENLKSYIALTG